MDAGFEKISELKLASVDELLNELEARFTALVFAGYQLLEGENLNADDALNGHTTSWTGNSFVALGLCGLLTRNILVDVP